MNMPFTSSLWPTPMHTFIPYGLIYMYMYMQYILTSIKGLTIHVSLNGLYLYKLASEDMPHIMCTQLRPILAINWHIINCNAVCMIVPKH